jgi:hypothetical protein
MRSPGDSFDIQELSPALRQALAAFEAAQQSDQGAAWQTIDGGRALVLPDGTRYLTTALDGTVRVESRATKIGGILAVGGIGAADGAWELRDARAPGLLVLATLGAILLLALGARYLLAGRRTESTTRRRVVLRRGMFLLHDALVERAGEDGERCRVFLLERLVGFDYANNARATLRVGCRDDAGEVQWIPTIGGRFAQILETWRAGTHEGG